MNQFFFRRALPVMAALSLSAALGVGVFYNQAMAAGSLATAVSVPIAENLTLSTYRDVSVSGQLTAVDPEGDLLTYQLTSQPARGKVSLEDAQTGVFCYTPYDKKTGADSFTYVAMDSEGNISQPATVKITISRTKSGVSYADLEENGVGAFAQRLAEKGVFVGARVGENWCFQPEATVTRGEFLTMAMAALEVDSLKDVTTTGFADDGAMTSAVKCCAASALQKGYISGVRTQEGISFLPEEGVTAAQAAVILNNMLSLTDASAETFAGDRTNDPAWASQAVVNLISCGIPCQEPEVVLTRAQAAEMLCGAMEVVEARENSSHLWF